MKIKKAFDICKKNKIISIFGNEKGNRKNIKVFEIR